MLHDTPRQITTDEYVKIPGLVGLYRNTENGRCYGVKTVRGEDLSLGTTDRKIADRRLRTSGSPTWARRTRSRTSSSALSRGRDDRKVIERSARSRAAALPSRQGRLR